MNSAALRVDQCWQCIGVGAFELIDLAILEQQPRKLVTLLGQLFQNRSVGRVAGLGFTRNRKLQLIKQHGAQLWRRIDVELVASQLENLFLQKL